ncbi:MAG TPA: hypothetical protein VKV02_05575, partial [Acidobacteriaceae bacterium]|nr:hypothetical protein [Acidobacteriaceae bacterium]
FGFALLMAAWLIRLAILRRTEPAFPLWRPLLTAGLLSLILLLPFFGELAAGLSAAGGRPDAHSAPSTHLFSLSVRRMIDSGLLTGLPVFAHWNANHPLLLDQTLRLLLLLPGLAMELGVYGAVLVLLLLTNRRQSTNPRDPAHSTALFFTLCGLVMTMFLSSAVITNNDFGYRAVMLPQFFLLLLTAELLGSWRFSPDLAVVAPTRSRRRLVYSLLLLGIAGSLYWAVLLRAWLPLEARHPQTGYTPLPADELAIRQAFDTLHRVAPPGAVVAFRPIDPTPDREDAVMVPNEFYQRTLVMNTGRQLLNAEDKCATHFGGNPAPCADIQQSTAQLYALPAPDAPEARDFCRRFGVQYLVFSAWDPDWNAAGGWPVTLPVVAQQPRFRILQCQ